MFSLIHTLLTFPHSPLSLSSLSWVYRVALTKCSSTYILSRSLFHEVHVFCIAGLLICRPQEDSRVGLLWTCPISSSVRQLLGHIAHGCELSIFRTRIARSGLRPDQKLVSQPIPALHRILGRWLDTVFHPHQWILCLLAFQRFSVLYSLCVWPVFPYWYYVDTHSTDVNIPIFLVLYFGYKIIFRTKFWKPMEMDFVTVSFNDNLCSIFLDSFTGHPDTGRDRNTRATSKEFRRTYCQYSFLNIHPGSWITASYIIPEACVYKCLY